MLISLVSTAAYGSHTKITYTSKLSLSTSSATDRHLYPPEKEQIITNHPML